MYYRGPPGADCLRGPLISDTSQPLTSEALDQRPGKNENENGNNLTASRPGQDKRGHHRSAAIPIINFHVEM